MKRVDSNYLDLGIFMPVANNGWILSTESPKYSPSHAMMSSIAERAENAGFEFLLGMTKFRGYGGETNFWNEYLESIVSMTALIGVTERINLIASVALPTLHPAIAARMLAAASLASNGRFGLNIVSGWNKAEFSQMGLWPGDWYYGSRYDYATEYVQVMRELWTTGRSSFRGEYFNLDDCILAPQPEARIPLVAAGMSERGLAFTSSHADFQFTVGDEESLRDLVIAVDDKARSAGRQVGVYAAVNLIPAATTREAKQRTQEYLDAVDLEGLMNLQSANTPKVSGATGSAGMAMNLDNMPDLSSVNDANEEAVMVKGAVLGGPTLVGSYQQIARSLDALKFRSRVSGVMITVPDFDKDLNGVIEHVLPNMKSRRSSK